MLKEHLALIQQPMVWEKKKKTIVTGHWAILEVEFPQNENPIIKKIKRERKITKDR